MVFKVALEVDKMGFANCLGFFVRASDHVWNVFNRMGAAWAVGMGLPVALLEVFANATEAGHVFDKPSLIAERVAGEGLGGSFQVNCLTDLFWDIELDMPIVRCGGSKKLAIQILLVNVGEDFAIEGEEVPTCV